MAWVSDGKLTGRRPVNVAVRRLLPNGLTAILAGRRSQMAYFAEKTRLLATGTSEYHSPPEVFGVFSV